MDQIHTQDLHEIQGTRIEVMDTAVNPQPVLWFYEHMRPTNVIKCYKSEISFVYKTFSVFLPPFF